MADNDQSFEDFIADAPEETQVNYGRAERLRDSIKHVASSRKGRAFLYELLAQTGYKQSEFHPDSRTHAFNSGQRNIGLWAEGLLNEHVPEGENNIIKEAREDIENDRRSNNPDT